MHEAPVKLINVYSRHSYFKRQLKFYSLEHWKTTPASWALFAAVAAAEEEESVSATSRKEQLITFAVDQQQQMLVHLQETRRELIQVHRALWKTSSRSFLFFRLSEQLALAVIN